jgi:hypothetical protein
MPRVYLKGSVAQELWAIRGTEKFMDYLTNAGWRDRINFSNYVFGQFLKPDQAKSIQVYQHVLQIRLKLGEETGLIMIDFKGVSTCGDRLHNQQ